MSKVKIIFENLKKNLLLEKEEDFIQFRKFISNLSLKEKREKGVCWSPLVVNKTGFTYGDRAYIDVERTTQLNEPHRLKAGTPVNFSSNQNDSKTREISGIVHSTRKNKMRVVLNSNDVPDWIGLGNLAIELLFDERTYREMEGAIDIVAEAKGNRLAEIRDILLGFKPSYCRNIEHPIQHPDLNASQNTAVNDILNTSDISVIHGPPGTGKTTTLVKAIKLLSHQENSILVTAPSNAAVDLLTERLFKEGLSVVRLGNISRVDDSLISLTLEGHLATHPDIKSIKKVKKQAAECRRKAQKFKRKFDHAAREDRRNLYREAKELSNWANQLEERLIEQILTTAHAICCTFVHANHKVLQKMKFRTVVIDEAAQALEPATWIPIIRASRVVLAGDPLQLPPTVKSNAAQQAGLGITLIEKCIEHLDRVNLLNVQYRMNQAIMGFSNQEFYNNKLLADVSVENWQLHIEGDSALEYIDTAGCGFEEQYNAETKSRGNENEYLIIREHLLKLLAHFMPENCPSIALISPYREQVRYMEEQFEEDSVFEDYQDSVSINTIDGFQGQERDVVYISLVRSNDKGQIGFLSDYRRMNVAMTRAKKKLVVVGDSATIGNTPFYQHFLDYTDAKGSYQSAWEYMQ